MSGADQGPGPAPPVKEIAPVPDAQDEAAATLPASTVVAGSPPASTGRNPVAVSAGLAEQGPGKVPVASMDDPGANEGLSMDSGGLQDDVGEIDLEGIDEVLEAYGLVGFGGGDEMDGGPEDPSKGPQELYEARSKRVNVSDEVEVEAITLKTLCSPAALSNLTNTIIGAGILALPWVFARCGILLGTVMVFVSGLLTAYTLKLLLWSSQLLDKWSYHELGYEAYGRAGQVTVMLTIIFGQFGIYVSYLVILADIFPHVIEVWFGHVAVLTSRVFVTLALWVVVFPLVCLRNIKSLQVFSYASLLIYVFFLAVLTADALYNTETEFGLGGVVYVDFTGVLRGFPIIVLAYQCHCNVFPIYREMKNPMMSRMSRTADMSIVICAVAYTVAAMGGYMSFRGGTNGDVLNNFESDAWWISVVKLSFALAIILTFPLAFYPCRYNLLSMIAPPKEQEGSPSDEFSGLAWYLTTFLMLAFATLVALVLPAVEKVFGLTGASTALLQSYILPSLIFVKAQGPPYARKTNIGPALIVVMGLFTAVLSTTIQVMDLVRHGAE